jgi:hypothetical protein
MARRRRHRNARRVVVVNRPRRRHRRRTNRARRRYNPPRYHRRRHLRRRHRRNPSRAASRVAITRPMTWLPYVFAGGAAATLSAVAPRLIYGASLDPVADANKVYLVQAGVAVAGAVVLPMVGFRGWYPMAWIVGAAAPIVAHFVGERVTGWLGLSGTGWYPYQALHQAPYYPPRLYGGVGESVGMYPFEGGRQTFTYPEQSFAGAPEAPFEHMYNN